MKCILNQKEKIRKHYKKNFNLYDITSTESLDHLIIIKKIDNVLNINDRNPIIVTINREMC